MALWGQGDARWIVEEREDAKNVNNWHWSEVDAGSSSKSFFKDKFLALSVTGSEGSVRISEVTKCDGEATINNRKGKVIFFFEWTIELKWCGKTEFSNDNITGKINIQLSEENSAEESDISSRATKDGKEHVKLHQIVKSQLVPQCRAVIEDYIRFLQEYHGNKVLKTKDGKTDETKTACDINSQPRKTEAQQVNTIKKKMDETVISRPAEKPPVTTRSAVNVDVKLQDSFKCRREDLFRCFTDTETMCRYFRAPCQVDAREGGQFSLLSGAISGTFLEIQPHDMLHLHWRFADWPADQFSSVTLLFTDSGSSTDLSLTQVGVPEHGAEQIRSGWKKYYFNPIKQTFGYGSGSL